MTSAAPVCGATGAQKVAVQQAAVETIKRGFDRFIVLGGQSQNNVGVIGHTPVIANSTTTMQGSIYGNNVSAYGNTTTSYSGGYPMIAGSHDQGLVIKMFHDGDPVGANGVSARDVLGPDWQKIVEGGGPRTCG